ncbi:DUF461 domain-containing protein [Streptomyces lydicus]|uniref:DUF461 domain-containing protein n=1 Tax=Streptomyces lydicus TaxID=47763 RepID=UPI003702A5F3
MSRSLRRGVLAATVLSLSVVSLSACAAGNDAQTLQVKPDNAATSVGDIKIQNANVITQPDVNAKGPAVLAATVYNNGAKDQKLTAIDIDGTGQSAKLTPAGGGSGPITVPAGGSVVLGGKDNASAVLTSGREAVQDGNIQSLTFTLSTTGKVKANAYVVPATSYFQGYGPSQLPQPSGSASPSGSAKPSESGKPSGTASPSTSGKPGSGAHAGH